MLEVCPVCPDTSAKTTTPLADSGINDRLVKLRPHIDQTYFEFIDVSNFGVVDFERSRCCSRQGSDLANSAATVSEV